MAGVSRPSAPEIKREPKRHVKREVKREHQDRSAGAGSSSSSSSASASRSDAKMPATPELNRMGYRRIGDGMAMVDVDGEKQPMRTCLRRHPPIARSERIVSLHVAGPWSDSRPRCHARLDAAGGRGGPKAGAVRASARRADVHVRCHGPGPRRAPRKHVLDEPHPGKRTVPCGTVGVRV